MSYKQLFTDFFIINLTLIFPLFVFGFFISLLKKSIRIRSTHPFVSFFTIFWGLLGVPFHELSHLIFCVLFHHKVIKVALFRPIGYQKDHILGYVRHSYRKNSIYQTIGCFFIGIAPMLLGAFAIVFLAGNFLLPDAALNRFFLDMKNFSLKESPSLLLSFLQEMVRSFQASLLSHRISFWISFYAILSISLHMTISSADFANAKKGFFLFEGILLFFCLITEKVDFLQPTFSYFMQTASFLLLFTLLIAGFIYLFLFFVRYVIYAIIQI